MLQAAPGNVQTPPNPAIERAGKVWDRRLGDLVIRNANLRKLCFVLAFVILGLTVGIVYIACQSEIVPYVVEVDKSTGKVISAGNIKDVEYTPQQIEITYFLTEFIKNTRGMPLDKVVYTENWTRASYFMTKDCQTKMEHIIRQEGLIKDFGKKTVQINIISVLPVGDSHSYEVRWTEDEFVLGSGGHQTVAMSGNFTIELIPVKENDRQLLKFNPLGMFISDFYWDKDAATAPRRDTK